MTMPIGMYLSILSEIVLKIFSIILLLIKYPTRVYSIAKNLNYSLFKFTYFELFLVLYISY